MINPIITPVYIPHNSESPKCPNCHKEEDIIEVCRNCGHEYERSSSIGWTLLIVVLACILIGWFMLTMMEWISSQGYSDKTLFEIIKGQFQFIGGLRIW